MLEPAALPVEKASPRSDRRGFVCAFLLAGLLVSDVGMGQPPRAGDDLGSRTVSPPNLLIYLVDTLRADHLSAYGYARKTSPKIDAFAKDAILFANAYSPTSWTKPAAASLLTGLNPVRHGAIARSDVLDPGVRLLGHYLRKAGYQPAPIVTNPNVLPVWGFGRGFDHFYDIESVTLKVRADRVNALVFRHLHDTAKLPFFLYVHTIDPHTPYDAPPPYDRKWPRHPDGDGMEPAAAYAVTTDRINAATAVQVEDAISAYDGEISFNDHHFGLLLEQLKTLGLYKDTLVVFTSDHGEEFREHNGGGHGRTLFEEVVRVPLIVKLPRSAHAGSVVRDPLSLVDILPTVLAAVGQRVPPGLDGQDLTPLLETERKGPPAERRLFFELDNRRLRVDDVADGVRMGRYKLLRVRKPQRAEILFDLQDDPDELRNVAEKQAAVVEQLERALDEYRAEVAAGVHLWFVSHPGSGQRTCDGSIRTSGTIQKLRTLQFEAGDTAAVAEDRHSLGFKMTLSNRPNPTGRQPSLIVDVDQIHFRTKPENVEIIIEVLRCDGGAATLYLGTERKPVRKFPLVVAQDSPGLWVEQMRTLVQESRSQSVLAEAGGYLGVVPPRRREQVQLEPAMAERLRALGYSP